MATAAFQARVEEGKPPTAVDLIVHSLTTSHQPVFTTSGQIVQALVVRYMIGAHGPFTLTYTDPKVGSERIKEDLISHVKDLRELEQALPNI